MSAYTKLLAIFSSLSNRKMDVGAPGAWGHRLGSRTRPGGTWSFKGHAGRLVLGALSLGSIISFVGLVTEALAEGHEIGRLFSKEGSVEGTFGSASPSWRAVELDQVFSSLDSIRVGEVGRAGISFADGGFIRLSSRAQLSFNRDGQRNQLTAESGNFHFFSRSGGLDPEIRTPVVSAAARGTEFALEVSHDKTVLTVLDGSVLAENSYGSVSASSGEVIETVRGSAPVKRYTVNPRDAVQWTFYSPFSPDSGVIPSELNGAAKSLWVGELARADAALDASALQRGGSSGASAKALKAFILVLRQKFDEAAQLSEEASRQAPDNELVALVSSYVKQSGRDLEGARNALSALAQKGALSATSYARLAELELSFDRRKEARGYLDLALAHDGNNVPALIVKGFLELSNLDSAAAKETFSAVLARDSVNSQAYLGRALAQVADNQLTTAQGDLERAVALEPGNAVYRSYLGKLFFEQGKEDQALQEFLIAERSDPLDPTPHLYRAFTHLSKNNPIAALRDVEQSIALNDARAVYRSSFLLDQDRAVRSTSLGRVFSELGLKDAARIEAYKSLNSNYLNYSAHRMLGDTEDAIAFFDSSQSELRIADLLAPLNLTFLSSAGGSASLNDYSQVFDRSETRTAFSLSYDGRDDLYGGNAVTAFREGSFGAAVQAQSTLGDGLKSGNYLRDYGTSLRAQYQIDPDQRASFDVRGQFRQYEDTGGSPQDSEFRSGTAGIGYGINVSSQTTVVAQVSGGRDRLSTLSLENLPALVQGLGGEDFFVETISLDKTREDLNRLDAGTQIIWQGDDVSVLGGIEGVAFDTERNDNSLIIDDDQGLFTGLDYVLRSSGVEHLRSGAVYTYSTIHATSWADIVLGGSYASVDFEKREVSPFAGESYTRSRFNPKAGLFVTPWENLTLRGAYFQTLGKSVFEDQAVLEPTSVAGMIQRFNDRPGTEAENFGFGADYKIGGFTYVGAEWIRRRFNESSTDAAYVIGLDYENGVLDNVVALNDFDQYLSQDLVRSYMAHTFSEQVLGALEYQYSESRRLDPTDFQSFKTHRLGGTMRFFDSSGLFAFARGTWREQDRTGGLFLDDGTDRFFLVDLGLGYRLPRRGGRISLEVLNVFDQDFQYDQSLGYEAFVSPELGVRLEAAVNF